MEYSQTLIHEPFDIRTSIFGQTCFDLRTWIQFTNNILGWEGISEKVSLDDLGQVHRLDSSSYAWSTLGKFNLPVYFGEIQNIYSYIHIHTNIYRTDISRDFPTTQVRSLFSETPSQFFESYRHRRVRSVTSLMFLVRNMQFVEDIREDV